MDLTPKEIAIVNAAIRLYRINQRRAFIADCNLHDCHQQLTVEEMRDIRNIVQELPAVPVELKGC